MAENLKKGDVVILNSGGPKMTVEYPLNPNANRYSIGCIWFDQGGIKRGDFAAEIVTKVEDKKFSI